MWQHDKQPHRVCNQLDILLRSCQVILISKQIMPRYGKHIFNTLWGLILFPHGTKACSGPRPPHYWGFTITLLYTPHSLWLLWMSHQPNTETSTWQHTTLTTDRHQCPLQDSNPQPQQVSSCQPTSQTSRPLGSEFDVWYFSELHLYTLPRLFFITTVLCVPTNCNELYEQNWFTIHYHHTEYLVLTIYFSLLVLAWEMANFRWEYVVCPKSKCTDFLFNYLLDLPEITSYLLRSMTLGKLHSGSNASSTDHSSTGSHFP